ncbi:MAG: hypothetical protein JWQ98_3680 [Chlorobi bacterium]|nr:hypothetical protein [Chlorobiota bacterium]
MPARIRNICWLLLLLAVSVAVYSAGLRIDYNCDDFQFVFDRPSEKVFTFFLHATPFNGFYRPLQAMVLALTQALFGMETWPIRAINLLLHALLCWLIYLFMRRERFSGIQAGIASLFMAVSQANAAAVLGNDTQSQISGALFGCLSLWLLHTCYRDGGGWGRYALSLLVFYLALISKESSAALPALVAVVIMCDTGEDPRTARGLAGIGARLFPYGLLTGIYLTIRATIGLPGPRLGLERYAFHFGLNMPVNLMQFLIAWGTPVSSVTGYVLLLERAVLPLVLVGAATLAFLLPVGIGLWGSPRRKMIGLMFLMALGALVPAVFLNHVGELYLYNAMPYLSVLVGIGLGGLLERSMGNRWATGLVVTGLAMLLAGHVIAVRSKSLLMKEDGDRATVLLRQLAPYAAAAPRDGIIYLLNPHEHDTAYSTFLLPGFRVFLFGENIVPHVAGRGDIVASVIDRSEVDSVIAERPGIILTYDPGTLWLHEWRRDR